MKENRYKLDIKEWGPAGWTFLMACIFMFPKNASQETQTQYLQFFSNIGNILPCGICSEHFNKYLKDHPIPIQQNARSLAEWLHNLHNEVNETNGEKQWPFLKMVKQYMPNEMAKDILDLSENEIADLNHIKLEEPSNNNYPKTLIIVLSVIIVVLIIVLILVSLKFFCKNRKVK